MADHRREPLAGLTDRVIEVGPGTGLDFAHCPTAVDEAFAVEPESYLRELALKAAADVLPAVAAGARSTRSGRPPRFPRRAGRGDRRAA